MVKKSVSLFAAFLAALLVVLPIPWASAADTTASAAYTVRFDEMPHLGSSLDVTSDTWLLSKGLVIKGDGKGILFTTAMSGTAGSTGSVIGYASPDYTDPHQGINGDEVAFADFMTEAPIFVTVNLAVTPDAAGTAPATAVITAYDPNQSPVATSTVSFDGIVGGVYSPASVTVISASPNIHYMSLSAPVYPAGGVYVQSITWGTDLAAQPTSYTPGQTDTGSGNGTRDDEHKKDKHDKDKDKDKDGRSHGKHVRTGWDRANITKEKSTSVLLKNPDIVGVGIGKKGKDAVIRVYTTKSSIKGLPKTLDGVPVVIQVTGKLKSLAGRATPTPTPTRTTTTTKATATPATTTLSNTALWPRPIPIGISTGNKNECAAGTIGARVKDASGNVYALSNNHVYARGNSAIVGEEITQPGLADAKCTYKTTYRLGSLAAYEPLRYDGTANVMDAAIALTDVNTLGKSTPSKGYGTPSSTTTAAVVGTQVQKYGRATSLTTGQITDVNATIKVTFKNGTATFAGQIVVQNPSKVFMQSGDSGALLVTQTGANPVGLLFAGDSTGKIGFANPIGPVLNKFGVTIDGK